MAYDEVSRQVFFAEAGLECPGDNLHTVRRSVIKRLTHFGVSVLNNEAGIATRRKRSEEIFRGNYVDEPVELR